MFVTDSIDLMAIEGTVVEKPILVLAHKTNKSRKHFPILKTLFKIGNRVLSFAAAESRVVATGGISPGVDAVSTARVMEIETSEDVAGTE